MQFFTLYRFSIFFFVLAASLSQVFFKNIAFAQPSILQIDKTTKPANELVDQIFSTLYEDPALEPNIEFYDYSDLPLNLKDFRNNFVVLYFWATWCNTCAQEMQSMTKMVEQLEFQDVKDVVVLPISIDFKNNQQISEFYKKNKLLKLRMFKDNNKQLMSSLSVTSLPTTFLINKDGYIIQGFEQSINWNDKYLIKKLLEIKGPYVPAAPIVNVTKNANESKKEDDTAVQSNIIPEVQKKKTPTIIN